jgi:DNA-binding NtrC family response regulator
MRALVAGDDPSELVSLDEIQRRYTLMVLEILEGNRSAAARTLRIGRKTLYRKLVGWGVPSDELRAHG